MFVFYFKGIRNPAKVYNTYKTKKNLSKRELYFNFNKHFKSLL